MCSVKVYQDAHCKDGELPDIKLEEGAVFEHAKYWEDICHAILEAHHLIYIVGWSIYHRVKLVREPTREVPHIFQSTDSESVKGFPKNSQKAQQQVMLYMEASCSKRHLLIRC
ncbi:hypothetical protein Cni_G06840 [Canna indica]|uniref:Uncharacterized protein n=1 Tax=Canna indica TaxID=4628 RepID=A0AAQ3Q4D0_9LILI|nr:hypothetical protein Cni_G06840 [Canna indica]